MQGVSRFKKKDTLYVSMHITKNKSTLKTLKVSFTLTGDVYLGSYVDWALDVTNKKIN